jgi:hypothetical protein
MGNSPPEKVSKQESGHVICSFAEALMFGEAQA